MTMEVTLNLRNLKIVFKKNQPARSERGTRKTTHVQAARQKDGDMVKCLKEGHWVGGGGN